MNLSKDNAGATINPVYLNLCLLCFGWINSDDPQKTRRGPVDGYTTITIFTACPKLPLGQRGNVAIMEIMRSYVPPYSDPCPSLFAMPYWTICTFAQIPARNPIARECGGLPRSDQDLRGCHHAGLCCPTSGNNSLTIGNIIFCGGTKRGLRIGNM